MAAPKVPAAVEVGPHSYAVIVDPIAWHKVYAATASIGLAGQTDHTRLTIHLDPDNVGTMQADTLLHEILHAVFTFSGVSRDLGFEKEEDAVNRIAPALLAVLRRNPALVAYLTSTA
jgi:hypothetical protein